MPSLNYSDATRLLQYDEESGKLFWKQRTPDLFSNGRFSAECECSRWNTRFAGREAFTATDGKGYKHGRIMGKLYCAHRVAWLLHIGDWPEEHIDHINGDKADNRFDNLRLVTHSENMRNQRIRSDNSSGVVGVSWDKHHDKWVAFINVDLKQTRIGSYSNLEDAVAARKAAEVAHCYHPNHGRAA